MCGTYQIQMSVLDRQITCVIRKTPPTEDCTCVKYVGTVDSDHLIPISEVIKRIGGKDRFYVLEYETRDKVYVNVAQRGDFKYIRTESYDTTRDRLLKIGDCEVTDRPSYFAASLPLFGIKDIFDRKSKATKKGSI
jgi:hypothetical protein